ncbi:MAG: universal stress protein, partial [SAR202 cluster bacterium]|nr:universal stress protein [SAR202 cluster bacterium]
EMLFQPDLVLMEQLESLEQTEREAAAGTLKDASRSIRGLRVEHLVKTGKVVDVILKEAKSQNGDTLVAMSTHGRRGIQHWLLGSVADRVVRSGIASVMLVRPSKKKSSARTTPIKNVIVALDGSAVSEAALPVASQLAKSLKARLQLLRVIPVHDLAYSVEWIRVYEKARASMEREVTDYLEAKKRTLRDLDPKRISTVKRLGDPSEAILNLAGKAASPLIVMTSRGRGGASRTLLGSVADRVISHSAAPVLLVRSSER